MKHPVVWFEVLGNDGPKLQRFYAELFGWQIKSDSASGYGMVENGAKNGVPGGVGGSFQGFGPWVTFYVQSPDLAGSLETAKRLGGKVVVPPMKIPNGPEVAVFADPEGHNVGLVAAEPS